MPRQPTLTADQEQRVERICNIREVLPTDKQLAREMGVSLWVIHLAMKRARKRKALSLGDTQISANDGTINA